MHSTTNPSPTSSTQVVREIDTASQGALLLLGSPGVGKATQAKELSKVWKIPQISRGDLLRTHVANQTLFGRMAKTIMDREELVPDSLVTEMIERRLVPLDTRRGYILEGFPRTLDQANWLIETTERERRDLPICAVHIHLSRTQLLRRITGRRHCPVCQSSFNIYENRPMKEGFCDRDGAALIQRTDDTEGVFSKRVELYEKLTTPVLRLFQARGQFADVAGDGPIESITESLIEAVNMLSLARKDFQDQSQA